MLSCMSMSSYYCVDVDVLLIIIYQWFNVMCHVSCVCCVCQKYHGLCHIVSHCATLLNVVVL